MKNNSKLWKKWIYWFTFAIAIIFIYKTLDNFSQITNWVKDLFSIIMPFIIAKTANGCYMALMIILHFGPKMRLQNLLMNKQFLSIYWMRILQKNTMCQQQQYNYYE